METIHQLFQELRRKIGQLHLNEILSLRATKTLKDDGSYVTKGDLLVQDIIIETAMRFLENPFIVSEEILGSAKQPAVDQVVLIVDPIDGTENFTIGLPIWGVAICCYINDCHQGSMLGCPELDEWLLSGEVDSPRYDSRVRGLSSSLSKEEILEATSGYEYRILGCCVYNMMSVIRGTFRSFENPKGAWCWDIMPGLNLALEAGLPVTVDNQPYTGQYLGPHRKYCFKIGH